MFLFRRKKKSNIFTLFVLLIIIYSLYEGYFASKKIEFPFLKFKRNIIYIYEVTNGSKKDTLSVLQRSANYFRKLNSNLIKEFERNDSIWARCFFHGKLYIEEEQTVPFFVKFDSSNQTYSSIKLTANLKTGDFWLDENTGLKHCCTKIDTFKIKNKTVLTAEIETRLSEKSKHLIYYNINKLQLKPLAKKEILKSLNKIWKKWYATDIGLVKEILPNGEIKILIDYYEIYWFERIWRFFNYKVF